MASSYERSDELLKMIGQKGGKIHLERTLTVISIVGRSDNACRAMSNVEYMKMSMEEKNDD